MNDSTADIADINTEIASRGDGVPFDMLVGKIIENATQLNQKRSKIDGEEIVFHDYCDISIAVSAPKGLVVPVIRSAENMSLDEIVSCFSRMPFVNTNICSVANSRYGLIRN